MSRFARFLFALFLLVLVVGGFGVWSVMQHGISAREAPTAAEVYLARGLRRMAIPRDARETANPVAESPEVLAEARAHFADHCASCHGNDGKGQTELGRNLFPKAPDMTRQHTQALTDGEIFYIIENGVRLTGMPAWGRGTAESLQDSWKLVRFVRHIPQLTPKELLEMKKLNPVSPHELQEDQEAERFLKGEDEPSHPSSHGH